MFRRPRARAPDPPRLNEETGTHSDAISSVRTVTRPRGRRHHPGFMDSPDARCALVAANQHGCITRAQALACGLSPEGLQRRVRSGRWLRRLPRTYVLRGAPATWEQRLRAATLWAGDGAAASGRSAAALWGFPDSVRGPIEISHTGAKQSRTGIVVRRVRLDAVDLSSIRGIPVTTPARTLADLAARVSSDRFDAAWHYCLHQRLATLRDLSDVAWRRCGAGFPGVPRLREALAAYGGRPPAASPLEARFARRLRASGLPDAERQFALGGRYLDFAWPARCVAVEADGYRWHASRAAWARDRARLAELRRAGWTVVHVTQEDARRGFEEVIEELRELLR